MLYNNTNVLHIISFTAGTSFQLFIIVFSMVIYSLIALFGTQPIVLDMDLSVIKLYKII